MIQRRRNPILPQSSLSDVINENQSAKTSNVNESDWGNSSAVQFSGGNSSADDELNWPPSESSY
jgi:hypothetical protein